MQILSQPAGPVNLANKYERPPTTTQRTHIPYMFGLEDGQSGALCAPEIMWASRDQQVAYCIGYSRMAGHNDTTRYFLGGNQ